MTNFEEELARIEKELENAGIPNKVLDTPEKTWQALKRLEKAGIIKRKGYDLSPPFEKYVSPIQELQQPYF